MSAIMALLGEAAAGKAASAGALDAVAGAATQGGLQGLAQTLAKGQLGDSGGGLVAQLMSERMGGGMTGGSSPDLEQGRIGDLQQRLQAAMMPRRTTMTDLFQRRV